MGVNTFGAQGSLRVGDREYAINRLSALAGDHDIEHLPYSLKILLENLLRNEDGVNVDAADRCQTPADLRDQGCG